MTTRKLRLSLLALAATAGLATTALTPDTAAAWGRFGGGHFGGFHGYGRAFGWHGGFYNHYRFGWGFNHYRFGWRGPICGWGRCGYPHRWWGWYRWRAPIYGGLGAIGGAAVATAAPAMSAPIQQQPTNCLIKQYLPNGAVAFADTCTNEQAVAMPNGAPQSQGGPSAQ